MDGQNGTITVIYLLGLQTKRRESFLVFLLLFLSYFVIICGNLLIIILVSYSETLHTPMYVFLSQLSVSDILLSSDILPVLLHTVLVKKTRLSFTACITQFFLFTTSVGSECLLLTVMGYDRYVAICRPLHYRLMMSHKFCCITVISIWAVIILTVLIYALILIQLRYCGANVIDHFFCDFSPILQLSCSDTSTFQLVIRLLCPIFVVIPVLSIIVSYFYIAAAVFKIPSNTGRKKAFSTCSSHLTVVSIYYGSLICAYMVPNKGQPHKVTNSLALLYTVVTPLMNPIVYCLRNQDLNTAGKKLIATLFHFKFRRY